MEHGLIKDAAEFIDGINLTSIELVDQTAALHPESKEHTHTYMLYKCMDNKNAIHYYMRVVTMSSDTTVKATEEEIRNTFPDYVL